MHYPIAIEAGDDTHAFGVVVPDLPGCFSAGDTFDEAMMAAKEAAEAWIDAILDVSGAVPQPSTLEAIRDRPDYAGWTFAVVELAERANTSNVRAVN